MKTRAYLHLKTVFVCLLALFAVAAHTPGYAAAGNEVLVPIHRAELVSLPSEISEVIVANPEIADVYVHGKSKVSVIGKAIGTTNIRVMDKKSRVLRSMVVRVTYDLPAIRETLHQLFPYEDISVQVINNNLALTGMVSDGGVAQKAVRIANEFLLPIEEKQRPRGGHVANGDEINRPMLHL